ncbi:ATP-dependent helicase HrpB [Salisaeta longa]|uniref:ATP-dependent helicase HrpB n=1 Tax=Salisaeta longa TaxID=503170 RepID=UPI0003B49425|nr:ATP-dependent helicase HrpB [Salisaeta longa]
MALPIHDVLPDLQAALRRRSVAVLEAPTGAGKTTRVPLALHDEPWLAGQRLIMLEPRRLAARSAARFMAQTLGESVGDTVGYRVRMDTKVGPNTRIEVVTEGILARMLQDDPELAGVGAVVFDEFHERNLQADLGLALALETQEVLRPDLRLLVMSATLDTGPIASFLGDAPLIRSEGRSFPVEVAYRPSRHARTEDAVAHAVRTVLPNSSGDVLVFLPGAGEIRRTAERLEGLPAHITVHPLFGNLSPAKQDAAIAPSAEGERKIVLATDIAETSLTIEGVRVVVDSGLRRTPRFDTGSGMTRLETVPISQAAAEQRRGRAGRVAPGRCIRLWAQANHRRRAAHTPPEMANADLASLVLQTAAWGASDPSDLRWLDPPPSAAVTQAQTLLRRLGALNEDGAITDHGRAMVQLGLHPRLAHLLLQAETLGHGAIACDLVAVLSERDIFSGQGEAPPADLRLRLETLQRLRNGDRPAPGYARYRVKRSTARRVLKMAAHWRRKRNVARRATGDIEAAGLLTAFAYPDRIAQHRTGERFQLRSGRAAALTRPQLLSDAEYLVVPHIDGSRRQARIFLAAPLDADALTDYFGHQITSEARITWDGDAGRVRARAQDTLGALVVKDGPLPAPDATAMAEALAAGVREAGLDVLPWSKKARQLQARMQFMHHHDDAWPAASDRALLDALEDWLLPHLYGHRSLRDLQQLSPTNLLKERLSWERRERLDELAPTHWTVPSGSRRPIDYSTPEAPVLAARVQEFFGLTETPRILAGRVPLTLHLLSPAQRPVQITQDLAHFWDETYFDVRKDMRGRYPKHYWPEDPLTATPTNRVRPQ